MANLQRRYAAQKHFYSDTILSEDFPNIGGVTDHDDDEHDIGEDAGFGSA
jgi:hypothetical protein